MRQSIDQLSLKRKERFACPLLVLREAMLNAVLHRDYANRQTSKPTTTPSMRNKLLSEGFYLTGSIKKYGSDFTVIVSPPC